LEEAVIVWERRAAFVLAEEEPQQSPRRCLLAFKSQSSLEGVAALETVRWVEREALPLVVAAVPLMLEGWVDQPLLVA